MVGGLKDELVDQNMGRQYQHKVNNHLSYGFLKNRVLDLLHQKIPLEKVFGELESLFLKNTIQIREHRTNPRITQEYRYRTKPLVTKKSKKYHMISLT